MPQYDVIKAPLDYPKQASFLTHNQLYPFVIWYSLNTIKYGIGQVNEWHTQRIYLINNNPGQICPVIVYVKEGFSWTET